MSTTGLRLVYANAKNTLARHKINPAKAVLSQSYLRFEANLSANTAQYNFDVLVNETSNPSFVTQNKLNLQDSFIVSQIGVFIGLAASSSVSESKVPLYSYPDRTVFTAATAANLIGLYSGYLSLTVNQRVLVPSWDLYRHYCAPVTQTGYTPTGVTAGNIDNSINFGTDGFFNVEPNMVLVGSKKNQLQITLPAALTAPTANSRVVIICRGLLAQNSTPVR